MRGFIVLCLSAVAIAAPQGYNYNPAGQQAGFGVSSGLSTTSGSSGSFFPAAQNVGNVFHQGAAVQHHQQQHHQVQQQQHHQQQAVVSKRFYIHSAPEDVEEDYKEKHITVGVPRKNYNVVFIKSPSKSQKKTAIKISPAVNEEKTVIYVLNKKTDASDVQAEVIEQPTATHKPEVFFIKYKTNEEAQHAQQEIQSQYDALGGSSQITDEGIAPVTSVIGSLGGGAVDGAGVDSGVAHGIVSGGVSSSSSQTSFVGSSHAVSGGNSGNAYLPPNF